MPFQNISYLVKKANTLNYQYHFKLLASILREKTEKNKISQCEFVGLVPLTLSQKFRLLP